MRNLVLRVLISIAGIFAFLPSQAADPILTKGTWGGGDLRSATENAPIVSYSGSVLSIFFIESSPNVFVTVSAANGRIAYQTFISAKSGSTFSVPLTLGSGEYLISISYLNGKEWTYIL
jgi:hypothetical protein